MDSVKDRYKVYLQSRAGIDGYNAFKAILYGDNDRLVDEVFGQAIIGSQPMGALSICDIGAGDGRRTIRLCRKLHDYYGCPIRLDFIEQSVLQCADFERQRSVLDSFCSTAVFPRALEEVSLTQSYDIVFFIHSIFSLADFESFLAVCRNINKGGRVIVVANAGNSFLGKMKKALDRAYSDSRYEIDHLIGDLQRQGIPFTSVPFNTSWSIPEASVRQELTVILDWLSLGEYRGFDAARQSELLETAKSMSVVSNGRHKFSEQEMMLIICSQRHD